MSTERCITMSVPTKEQLKARSKHLAKLLQEKYKLQISHGHCLDVVAQLFGYKDWNTASAVSPEDESSRADSGGRYALIEALTQGFSLYVEQPYKVEKYFAGGSTANHSSEEGVAIADQFTVRTDLQNRNVTLTLPLTTSVSTSDAVIEMNKQLYLQREKFFAEKLGAKAADLAKLS